MSLGVLRDRGTLDGEGHLTLGDNSGKAKIRIYYRALFQAWGPQNWWPARSRFEVIVGAYLTQNTAWTNVEKALANLRSARLLSVKELRRVPLAELEGLIRPSGYFRQKAARLKTFIRFLDQRYGGSLRRMFSRPTAELREELLQLNGVGPETADSILLYAGNHPVFVVDAYTRRILERHGMVADEAGYEEIREMFEQALSPLAESVGESGELSIHKSGGRFFGSCASSVADEHGEAHGSDAGLQRNARADCGRGEELLQKITAAL